MTRLVIPPPDTVHRQRQAADPTKSVWVAANAGSGKTHVLTMRVLRLLLLGVTPESILCLTYTKAAAAEMRRRVSERLAKWALLTDTDLDKELFDLTGTIVSDTLRQRARTLFAHALETPGGLKIVTIHAFCESVLHRFPLEANVPFDFTVIEDEERAGMILRARESVLSGGLKADAHLAEAVAILFATLSDFAITQAIDVALAEGRKLRPVLAERNRAKSQLRRLVGYTGRGSREIHADVLGGRLIGKAEIARICGICPPKGGSTTLEDKLARIDPETVSVKDWMRAFLTSDNVVPAKFPKKALCDGDPDLAELVLKEARRLESLAEQLCKASLIERSEALLDVLGAIHDRYEWEKRARALLDFDDLIERLGDLFANTAQGAWVQYKLDAGITHILVDESQDTNPEQWRVVKEIAREFFVGDSAIERPRTLFAVGDEKQSIYSFQGADPRLFGDSYSEFRQRAGEVEKLVERVPLSTSFRTLEKILAAVDMVFDRADIRQAVLAGPDAPVHHDSARAEKGGMVTLWPPIQQSADIPGGDEWPLEALPAGTQSAERQIAEKIAFEVRHWIDSDRPLGGRGRAVVADDVLILVQSRGTLFREIIRALMAQHLPTPGADRLAVTSHIAVLDLLALGDVLLNTADDLQLAALLRSPLFEVSEDDLFTIAHGREGSLWYALQNSDLPCAREAFDMLHRLRGRLDFGRPYVFFAEVLYAEGGLRRFHTRFGAEVDDVLCEFLDMALAHEQTTQPSLQGFLTALRRTDVTVKRELAESGGGVRVMTVHGAKGLEAPIVILADAATKPSAQKLVKPVYVVKDAPGPLLLHASSSKDHVPETLTLRREDEDNQKAEYWRKLYVGMTRAEDELYVTGALTPGRDAGKQMEGSWYEAIEQTLKPHCEISRGEDGAPKALIYPAERPAPKPVEQHLNGGASAVEEAALDLPPLPEHEDRIVIKPSAAHASAKIDRSFETALDLASERLDAASAGVDGEAARREGTALHALLQHLGRVPRENWAAVLEKAMPALLPDSPERHAVIAQKAQSIIGSEKPELAALFGPNSRAEVPFVFDARRNEKPVRLVGRIDRLVVSDDAVLVVDYKSDASVPGDPQGIPQPYRTQLGLYAMVATQLFPSHTVRAAILWTSMESLMILPSEMLAKSVEAFTME